MAKGDDSVWRNLGNVLADDARREEALTAYLTAIVSGDAGAWVNVGVLFAEMGRLEEAAHVLEQAPADCDPLAQEVLPGVNEQLRRPGSA